uniref:Copia protein n=1 Tax=Tanacetum cinerariifolium TaxID=118510 RepID=A0A6L2JCK0_TANCI|nr:copia protein [Tanacetum cinerariifolium]
MDATGTIHMSTGSTSNSGNGGNGDGIRKMLDRRVLIRLVAGNGIDVVVPVEYIRAISERFANTAYGFFLGKRVTYPVNANYPLRPPFGRHHAIINIITTSLPPPSKRTTTPPPRPRHHDCHYSRLITATPTRHNRHPDPQLHHPLTLPSPRHSYHTTNCRCHPHLHHHVSTTPPPPLSTTKGASGCAYHHRVHLVFKLAPRGTFGSGYTAKFEVLDIIKGTYSSTTHNAKEWDKLDSLVKLWIFGTISKPLLQRVLKKNLSASDVRENLRDIFHDNKTARAMQLDNDLQNVELGNLSITDYFSKINMLADLLANIDAPVDDKNLVYYAINGLGEKYVHNNPTNVGARSGNGNNNNCGSASRIMHGARITFSPTRPTQMSYAPRLGSVSNPPQPTTNLNSPQTSYLNITTTFRSRGVLGSADKQDHVTQPTGHAIFGPSGPSTYTTGPLHDYGDSSWYMDTGATSRLALEASKLTTISNNCNISSILVGNGNFIPVINSGHSMLPTLNRPLHLHNVLVTPNIIKNILFVRQFTRDNACFIEFDPFGFSVKDLWTKHLLLQCNSTGELYLVVSSTSSPISVLSTNQSTWHQRLVSRQWPIHQLDVKSAFLHSHLSDTVYMHQPHGFVDPAHPHYVCLLQKSLYGLKQAPRAWFHLFASYAIRVGFQHSRTDSFVFIFQQGNDIAYLLIYVDDIILTASSSDLLKRIISSLHVEFSMIDLVPLNYFLRISAQRTSSGLFWSQTKYAREVLERADMINCNPCKTPADTESKLGPDGDPVSNPSLYRSLVGSLRYITFTHLDLSYAVQQKTAHTGKSMELHSRCPSLMVRLQDSGETLTNT